MHETVFWTGVVLLIWGPGLTVMFYGYGGDEGELSASVARLEASRSAFVRAWGKLLALSIGRGWRWVLSACGAVLLLGLKLAEG